jgi:hypothetical protein
MDTFINIIYGPDSSSINDITTALATINFHPFNGNFDYYLKHPVETKGKNKGRLKKASREEQEVGRQAVCDILKLHNVQWTFHMR